ncbi:STAS/SEC14 domain-containing protein [Lutibaculum baratangense]|uniref:STAS/SEC14 domain-containing protein n=1 Tax=Lutibaculum baratangense AMV1 TaxID=631454 RepID=V4R215_9HYPH|nr:STAS/SEC14 domain-containing protein [Lutibaculum baratangense]ESR25977.1 hypothetical protein N177_1312 [Lutibaculum baratangense AMV1]
MLTPVWGLPEGTVGFEAAGHITHDDYKERLIPALEAALEEHGKVRFLFVLGKKFEGYDPTAMFDDSMFGIRHINDFDRIAVVTDNQMIAGMIQTMGPMLPSETKVFPVAQLDRAKAWLGD